MKKLVLLATLIMGLTACEDYDVKNGDISSDGRILNAQLLEYAKNLEGIYHGKYVDVAGTLKEQGPWFVSEYTRYPAVLKFTLKGNKPLLQILLKVDVMPICMPEFTKFTSVTINENSANAIVLYRLNPECGDAEKKASFTISLDKETSAVSKVRITKPSGSRHVPLFVQNK